jgi:hypothetical protein
MYLVSFYPTSAVHSIHSVVKAYGGIGRVAIGSSPDDRMEDVLQRYLQLKARRDMKEMDVGPGS